MSKKLQRFSAFLTAAALMIAAFSSLTACKPAEKQEVEILTVRDIVLDTTHAKTEFAYGEEFSADGLKVTAILSDKSERDIPLEKCRISKVRNTPGKRKVSVTYAKKTKRYDVVFADKPMPPISSDVKLEITGIKTDGAYRMQAEDIDFAISGVQAVDGDLVVGETDKYVANYGNTDNYFGFTFTSDADYNDVTLNVRMANPSTERAIQPGSSIMMYLNYAGTTNNGSLGITNSVALEKSADDLVWSDFAVRGLNVKEGTNTLTFGVLDAVVPCIDYIDFYVGKPFAAKSTDVAAAGERTVVQIEDMGFEKVTTRNDYLEAYDLEQGEVCVLPNGSASDGKAVFALQQGEMSTIINAETDSTVQLILSAACNVNFDWSFDSCGVITLDGQPLEIQKNNIRDESNPNTYMWKDTSLGFYDLAAGEHLLNIKINNPHASFDALTIKTVSDNGFAEKKPEMYLDGEGTFVMEGEHLDPSGVVVRDDYAELVIGQPYGAYNIVNDIRASGRRAIDGFTGKPATGDKEAENTVFTFDFYLAQKATVDINAVVASQLGVNFTHRNQVIVRIDDAVCSPVACNLAQYWNTSTNEFDDPMFVDTQLAHRNLEAGMHTFKFEVCNFFFILDCIKFNVVSYGEFAPDAVIDGTGEYYIEAEKLDPKGVIARKDFITAGRILSERDEYCVEAVNNPHGGFNIAGLDTGSKLTSAFELKDKASVRIYMGAKSNLGIAIWNQSHVKFLLDGKTLKPNVQSTMQANNNSWIELEIEDLANLDKGMHEFVIDFVQFTFELDYIKISVVEYGSQTYGYTSISDNGEFKIEAEKADGREAIIRDDFKPYKPNDRDNYGVFDGGTGKFILGMQTGSKIKIYFSVEQACDIAIWINARGGDNSSVAPWDTAACKFYLNGEYVSPPWDENSRIRGEFADKLILASKHYEPGNYTYCMELLNFTNFNIDYFKLVVTNYAAA